MNKDGEDVFFTLSYICNPNRFKNYRNYFYMGDTMSKRLEKFLEELERRSKLEKESKVLKMFKPPRRLSLYDVTPEAIKEQLRRLPKKVVEEKWPLNVCRYIKVCLDRGGYAISFYPLFLLVLAPQAF